MRWREEEATQKTKTAMGGIHYSPQQYQLQSGFPNLSPRCSIPAPPPEQKLILSIYFQKYQDKNGKLSWKDDAAEPLMNRLSSSGTMHLCLPFLQTRLLTLSYTGLIVSPGLGTEQMRILTEYSLAEQVFIEKTCWLQKCSTPAAEVPGNTPLALNYQEVWVSPVPQDERGNSVSEMVTKTQPGVCTSWQCQLPLTSAAARNLCVFCRQPSCSRHTAKALPGL